MGTPARSMMSAPSPPRIVADAMTPAHVATSRSVVMHPGPAWRGDTALVMAYTGASYRTKTTFVSAPADCRTSRPEPATSVASTLTSTDACATATDPISDPVASAV